VGILERELDRDHRWQGRGPDRNDQGRNDVRRQEGRKQEDRRPEDRRPEKQNGGKGRQEREGSKKVPLRKREPVRLTGTVVILITTGALALFGYKVPTEQRILLNDLLVPIIPVIVPVVAGFGVARSKVDSTVTVERKMKEEGQR